jgi:4-amino-4-deoxy-L-arabinose transferase-like glycosyltransferase
MPSKMSISDSARARSLVVLLLVLAIAAFLRLYHLTSAPPGLCHDEAMNGIDCLRNLESHHLEVFYPDNAGREGLFINIATFSVYCFGNTAWALRFPAAILGVLTVLGVYLIAAEMFSRPVALLASFFVATSFWHVLLSRLGLRAIAAPVFLTFGSYLLLMGLRRASASRPYVGAMLSAGVVYGLGFHTYIAYRATPALVGAILVHGFLDLGRQGRREAFWMALAAFCAGVVLTTGPLALYFWRHPAAMLGRMSQVSVLNNPHPAWEVALNAWRTGRMFFRWGDRNWRFNFAYGAELFWPVAILFAGGVATSLARRRFSYWLVLFWMVVGAAPEVLSDVFLPNALRSILLVPPTFILAAIGANRLYSFLVPWLPRGVLTAAAVAFAVFLVHETSHKYFDEWARREETARAMEADATVLAQEIKALPRELPKYVAFYVAGEPRDELPAEAWVVQYLTRSYTQRQQQEANIHYHYCPANALRLADKPFVI